MKNCPQSGDSLAALRILNYLSDIQKHDKDGVWGPSTAWILCLKVVPVITEHLFSLAVRLP